MRLCLCLALMFIAMQCSAASIRKADKLLNVYNSKPTQDLMDELDKLSSALMNDAFNTNLKNETANRIIVAKAEKSLEIRLSLFGEKHDRTAAGRVDMGRIYGKTGWISKAKVAFTVAHNNALSFYPENDPRIADELINMANYRTSNGMASALPLYERAREIYRENKDPVFDRFVGYAETGIAQLKLLYGNSKEARSHAETALDIFSTAPQKDSLQMALARRVIGISYAVEGKSDRALSYLNRTLNWLDAENRIYSWFGCSKQWDVEIIFPINRTMMGACSNSVRIQKSRVLTDISNIYAGILDFESAKQYQKRSVKLYAGRSRSGFIPRKHTSHHPVKQAENNLRLSIAFYGLDHPLTGSAFASLAEAYAIKWEFAKASGNMKNALALWLKHAPTEAALISDGLISLGEYAASTGDFDASARYLTASEKALGSLPSINYLGQLTTTRELARASHAGMLYLANGDFDKAEQIYQQAVSASRKIRGSDHIDVLNSLIGLGDFYQTINSKHQASKQYQEVLKISESMFETGTATFDKARIRSALAAMRGDYSTALEETLKVRYQSEEIFETDSQFRLLVLLNLAHLYKENGLFDDTLRTLDEMEKHPLLAGREFPIHSLIYLIRAQALLGSREHTKAIDAAEISLYGFYNSGGLDINLWAAEAVLAQANMAVGNVNAAIYFGKTSVNRLTGLQTKLSNFDAQVKQDFLGDKQEVYRALAAAFISAGDIASAQKTLRLLKQEEYWQFTRNKTGNASLLVSTDVEIKISQPFNETTRNLIQVNLDLRQLRRQRSSPDLEEKIQTLTATKLLLRRRFTTAINDIKEAFSTLGIARNIELGEKRLDTLGSLQRNLANFGDDVAVIHYLVTQQKIHLIVTTKNGSFNRVQEIRSQELAQLIFDHRENLEDAGSDPVPIAQKLYEILMEPIAVELHEQSITKLMVSLDGLLRYIPFQSLHDGETWLVNNFMIANYTPATDMAFQKGGWKPWRINAFGVSEATSGFNALPSVVQELNGIVKTSNVDSGVLHGNITLNQEFTRSSFSNQLNRGDANIVHIASHFHFQPGRESESYLLIGAGEQITLGDFTNGDYPLYEIDLLTLSACNTGLSGISPDGSEIEGFGVLAQNQGAAAVLSSLWSVADESTSEFMIEFYKQREIQRVSKGEALRRVQISFINDPVYNHPFFWAPFTLMGNWL